MSGLGCCIRLHFEIYLALGLKGEGFVIVHITCKTDRFNLSVIGPDFINDCCFGEDFSTWLVSTLNQVGVKAEVVCMEDFGWANQVDDGGVAYLMNVGSTPDEDPSRPNFGEWHVLLERQRSVLQKLLGQNKASASDPIVGKVLQALQGAGFADVCVEP